MLALAILSAAAAPAGKAATPATCELARDGAARAVIAVARDASPSERHAADELAVFLKQVTGGVFPLKTPDETGGAFCLAVGPGAARALAPDLALEGLGADGIVIRGVAGPRPGLALTGGPGAPRGTLYAVYTFLEDQVGCRWWTATESAIPRRPTLAVPADPGVRYVPPIWRREQSFREGLDPDWSARSKLNAGCIDMSDDARGGAIEFAGRSCHTHYFLVPPSKYFAEHPEWFSEVSGKRAPEGAQLCLSNPDVLEAATRTAGEWLRANPRAKLISITQNDYQTWCTCAPCRAVDEAEGGPSGSNLRFANAVAEALEKEFPDVWVETFAYEYTRKPPRITRPRDNVVVRLCSIECDFAHPLSHDANRAFREDLEGWKRISKQLIIWDYVTNFQHYLQAHPNLRVLGPNIRFFRDHAVKGIFEQGNRQSLGAWGGALKSWVLARLLWNPDLDDRKLIDEFLDGYYGPAAAPLRAYLDLVHDPALVAGFTMTISAPPDAPYLAPEVTARAAALIEQAKAAAARLPDYLRRVERVELCVLYSRLVSDFNVFIRSGAIADPAAFLARLARFEAIASREDVTHVAESGDRLPEWVKRVRGVATGRSLPQTAWTAGLAKGEVAVIRLSAAWKFSPDPKEAGIPGRWFAADYSDATWATNRTDLDCGWERQGFPGYVGFGWYRQRFDLPAAWGAHKRLYVLFDAIDEEGWIHLNGASEPAFEHTLATTKLMPAQIWNLPFLFEATGKLRPGAPNLMAVRVYNAAFQGGIWRPVYALASDGELTQADAQAAIGQEPRAASP
jgi:hypothetical protein